MKARRRTSWQQNQSENFRATRIAGGFTCACARASSARPSGRGCACIARTEHIYAQVIEDRSGRTLVSASSIDKETRKEIKGGSNVAAAKSDGQRRLPSAPCAAGIEQVVFDRGGYMYHGRVEALAAAAREAGLKF